MTRGSMMEFLILGCLQVWDGDRLIDIAADKQKAVLAVLLLRAGQAVPVHELEEQVWGDAPPTKAKNTLQAYVYRLRQVLRSNSDTALVTEAAGYRMMLPDGALDLHRFEELTARGRAAIKAGQVDEGSAALQAALDLWRGPALADVSAVAVQADVQRLEDLRIAVAEDAAEAALALGRQAAMVPRLESLVAAHPYRERLWALLMVALCDTGRQADALAAYGRARARLREDLGIEPGPQLRQLQRDILSGRAVGRTGDADGFWFVAPAAAPPSRPRATGGGPVRLVAELPRDTSTFVGRRAELAEVCGWFDEEGPGRIGMINGSAGVGKTTLAVHAAHRLAARFPDGQFYANLHGDNDTTPKPAEILRRWLPMLGVTTPPRSGEGSAALFRSALATRRVLVVVDGAADLDHVSPLLPGAGTSAALVTGKRALTMIDGSAHLTLHAPDDQEALDLLRRTAGPERVDAELMPARTIVHLCENLPLAIRIVAARLAARPELQLKVMADQLSDEQQRLDELAFGGLTLRARIRAGYDRLLSADARRMFRMLGGWPQVDSTGVAAPVLAAHTGLTLPRVRAALNTLADAHLLLALRDGRYRMSTLIRLVAAELAPEPGDVRRLSAARTGSPADGA
ncbi:BTAD domain-containing putative transcriptional regulator [Streptosporangium amethystogenes]|uniref:AfsR/SARP family transcriptional regulator n=1 Tax=Streptosporangium amethystogenes TaxID=2002 RepID=UPI003795A411